MTNHPNIAGIQQIGIGVENVFDAFKWYREHFGMDIPIFEEAAEADHMKRYTGGKTHSRHAILALNIRGGGGFEIWQFTSRKPEGCPFDLKLGDLGIYAARIKAVDVSKSYDFMKEKRVNLLSGIVKDPAGNQTFYLKDPWNNIFQVVGSDAWFGNGLTPTGGVAGCIIGVSDMEKSLAFYRDILGYDTAIYDETGHFDDFNHLDGGTLRFRRVLLKHSKPRIGAFSRFLGSSMVELVMVLDRDPHKVYYDRFWGDCGFIHICFDITNQPAMKERCAEKGYPFTVDSGATFDMGEAAGHFSYIEDPDGALIEFVETKRIPILKKLGWYLDLTRRDNTRPLPNWMLKALKFSRVKD